MPGTLVPVSYDCGSRQLDLFEYCFSLEMNVPAEFSGTPLTFNLINIGPVFYAFGVPSPSLIYPNYFEVSLKCLAEPDVFFAFLLLCNPSPVWFCCDKKSKVTGLAERLLRSTVNMKKLRASTMTGLFSFAILDTVTALNDHLYNSALMHSICYSDDGAVGLPTFAEGIRMIANYVEPCTILSILTQMIVSAVITTGQTPVFTTQSVFDLRTSWFFGVTPWWWEPQPNTPDWKKDIGPKFPSVWSDILDCYLLSTQSLVLYTGYQKAKVVPLFYDGSPVCTLDAVNILDYELFNANCPDDATIGYFTRHFATDPAHPILSETSAYLFFSNKDWNTLYPNTARLLSNRYICYWSGDSRYDGMEFNLYPTDPMFISTDLQYWPEFYDYSHEVKSDSFLNRGSNGNYSTQYSQPHPAGSGKGSLFTFFMYSMERMYALNALGIKVRLKGLNYPIEKFFVFPNEPNYPFKGKTFRCRRYSIDLQKNETILDLFPA